MPSDSDDFVSVKVGDGVSRREVLKQFGAAGVAVGAAGCTDRSNGTPTNADTSTDTPMPTDTSTPTDTPGETPESGQELSFEFTTYPAVAPPGWDPSNTQSGAGNTERTAVFVYQNSQNPFFVPMVVGFNDALNNYGWTGQALAPQSGIGGDPTAQAQLIRDDVIPDLGEGDVLITTILDTANYNDPIQQALDKGIVVINGHTTPSPDDWNREFMMNEASGTGFDGGFTYRDQPMTIPHVGIQNERAGVAMAAEAYDRMQEANPDADELRVLVSNGLPVNPSVSRRVDKSATSRGTAQRYFESRSDPSVTLANGGEVLSTAPNTTGAESDIESAVFLDSLDGVVSAGYWGAVGAGNLRDQGQLGDDVVVGGFNLEPRMIRSIQNGATDFAIGQDPYRQGYQPVPLAWSYLERGMPMRDVEWGVCVYDESNIDFADERRNWRQLSNYQDNNYDGIGPNF